MHTIGILTPHSHPQGMRRPQRRPSCAMDARHAACRAPPPPRHPRAIPPPLLLLTLLIISLKVELNRSSTSFSHSHSRCRTCMCLFQRVIDQIVDSLATPAGAACRFGEEAVPPPSPALPLDDSAPKHPSTTHCLHSPLLLLMVRMLLAALPAGHGRSPRPRRRNSSVLLVIVFTRLRHACVPRIRQFRSRHQPRS